MDQMEMAIAMQRAAETHRAVVRDAESRRLLRERAEWERPTAPARTRVITFARTRLWLVEHLHLATHRPMAH